MTRTEEEEEEERTTAGYCGTVPVTERSRAQPLDTFPIRGQVCIRRCRCMQQSHVRIYPLEGPTLVRNVCLNSLCVDCRGRQASE